VTHRTLGMLLITDRWHIEFHVCYKVSSLWHTQGSMCHRSVLFNIPKVGCVTCQFCIAYPRLHVSPVSCVWHIQGSTCDRWHIESCVCHKKLTGNTCSLGYAIKNLQVTHRALAVI
jgi:hypothetical protein